MEFQADVVTAGVVAGVGDDADRAVVEGEERGGGVDIAGLLDEGRAAVAAGRVDLHDLPARHPADDVEVVHRAVPEDTARGRHVAGRRGRRVKRRGAHRVQLAEFAVEEGLPCGHTTRVEAAVEADLDLHVTGLDGPQHVEARLDRLGHRLLAEHGDARLDRGQDQPRVRVRRGGDHDSVDPGGEHGLGRVGHRRAELLGGGGGGRGQRVGDHQLLHDVEPGESPGMEGADTAQPQNANAHDECPFRKVQM